MQVVLETIVSNGLKASWSALGHEDGMGQILPLLKANEDLRRDNQRDAAQAAFVGEVGTGDSDEADYNVIHDDDA